ncbi:AAA domain-containing protein [Echinicola shivajiensis]|uniref:AAA domain-containing protein n=1 Tax=Echinicola shivajiensis TaxID=1035916 RepID=UPI001BFC37C8|nr:AAA domain-containing protein [Echinicola shivajiensis]
MKRELIYIDGKERSDQITSFRDHGDKCSILFKKGNKEYTYNSSRIKIVKTALSEDKAKNIFDYLKRIATTVGLKTKEGNNILAKSYNDISFLPKDCILSNYLNRKIPEENGSFRSIDFFPFGFNISQSDAVNNAFSHSLSVIEGPPGTGKTQTILNIIANAVMNGQSVAIVSSNNSATKNVYEKLEKNGLGFIAALLGNSQNKKDFIESQSDFPDLSVFKLSEKQTEKIKKRSLSLFGSLKEYLSKKNELALLKQELDNINNEYLHFKNTYKDEIDLSSYFRNNISSNQLLDLWLSIENQRKKNIGWIKRLIYRLKFGIRDKTFYRYSFSQIILTCQLKYYPTRIGELEEREKSLEVALRRFSFDEKMKEYTMLSMQLFKADLYNRYGNRKRDGYVINELRSKSSTFIKDYPVIMSTTYSLRQSLSDDISYDYLIMDESSQVDLATGALALSCAKKAVIVGDLKQLPNVVDGEMQIKTDRVFEESDLSEHYRYSTHSLLSSIVAVFPNVPKTLLREHYRCHSKIIEFCNRKFYDNQLIVHTESKTDRQPLVVYKTAPGNHARERMNQRQIDIIKHEIIPKERLESIDLGIVTPYRNQTNELQKAFHETQVKADTVDKFQGRENEVIILSTVDNEISDFTDNPNRLNVAVSRAIKQLIVVINGNESLKDNNITDLIRYIEYNNFTVTESELSSIFDYLYKGFEVKRAGIIKKSGRVSLFDSENLMYALIKEVLSIDSFSKYGVVLHLSVRHLIRDYSLLNAQELDYATHPMTHLDFLIYNKLSKYPVLAVEVDGYGYHKEGTRQAKRDKMKNTILEKYGLPLLRFTTNGSNEKEILMNKLADIQRN